jgi:hypothetical protein
MNAGGPLMPPLRLRLVPRWQAGSYPISTMQRPAEMEWYQPRCIGDVPNRRSGHSFTLVKGGIAYVFGGECCMIAWALANGLWLFHDEPGTQWV